MKSTIILSLVAALPMLAQCPCAKPAAPQQCPAMHRPCAQHRPNVEAMKARIMEKFDVNKDGQLDDQEKEAIKKDFEAKANEMKAKFMEKYDTDKDGQLSDEEKAAVKKEFEAKKAEASKKFAHRGHGKCHGKRHGMRHGHHGMRHGHHGMRHGKPCCGKPACGPRPMMAPAKFAEMKAKFMEKFDANKDGKIDEQEKEAIKKDFEAKANEMKAKFMEKYDTNKDGQLSDEEKAVVKKDFEAKKAEFAKKFAHRGHGKCHGMRHGSRHGKHHGMRHGHHGMRHGHHGMRHGKPCCGKPVCGPRPVMQKPCCGKPACGPRPVMVKAVRIQVAPAPQAPTCGIVPGSCGKPAMSKEETEARKAKFMEKFDADKDGQLSDEEKAAAKKFFECRMQVKGHRSHGMRGHRHGKPCFGKPMPGWQPKQPNCSRCRKPAPAPAPAEQPAA